MHCILQESVRRSLDHAIPLPTLHFVQERVGMQHRQDTQFAQVIPELIQLKNRPKAIARSPILLPLPENLQWKQCSILRALNPSNGRDTKGDFHRLCHHPFLDPKHSRTPRAFQCEQRNTMFGLFFHPLFAKRRVKIDVFWENQRGVKNASRGDKSSADHKGAKFG